MLKDVKIDPETLWSKGSKTFNYIARKINSDFWKKVFDSADTLKSKVNKAQSLF